MQGFNALRFHAYAKDLEQAVLRLSRESMSVQDLKEALKDIPGSSGLTVSYAGNGDQVISLGGRRIEVGPMASNDEIRKALSVRMSDQTENVTATPVPVVQMTPAVAITSPRKNLTGASFLANLIRQQQAAIKAQIAQAGTEMQAAMTELQDVANEATNQVKAVKAETADLKAALGLNSNGDPDPNG